MKIAWSVVLALIISGIASAQSAHTPTLDEMLSLRHIDSEKISPDGKLVAYGVRQTNWKDNEYVGQIGLVNTATGASLQLTRGKKSPGDYQWSPDGKWLAFTAERESAAIEPLRAEKKEEKKEGKSAKAEEKSEKGKEEDGGKPAAHQIWIISPEGGEAWQLTKSETDVDGFLWSKDGKSIAFTANDPESKSSKERKEKFSDYDVYEKDYSQHQLFLVDVSAALKDFLPVAAKRLSSDSSLNISSFSWSPDSSRIAFSAAKNPLLAFSGEQDIYLLELAQNNAVRKIIALPGPDRSPVFSPDGKQLAFATSLAQPYFYYSNGAIAVVDLATVLAKPASSPADVHDLTAKFDEDPDLLDWGPDGIYFAALQKTNGHVFRLNPATAEIRRLTAPDTFLLADISLSKDCRSAAFITEDSTHMGELFVSSLDSFAPKKLTDFTAQVKDWKLGSPEVVSWKSKDGASIEGILYKAADYDPTKRYPLLVSIHAGPTGKSRPTLSSAT